MKIKALTPILEPLALGITTGAVIVGIKTILENLQAQSDQAVLEFARTNHLGGTLLPIARNMLEFAREQHAAAVWHGALIGAAVTVTVILLVLSFMTTGKHFINRADYLKLREKATHFDLYTTLQGDPRHHEFLKDLKGYYHETNPKQD